MSGINRVYLTEEQRQRRQNQLCVFISHQKEDTEQCRKIAEYLKSIGIDVYFDEYDKDLKIAVQKNDAKGAVNAIRIGIKNSTHMLCVISPNTLGSKWVPFEVGYGYDITTVMVLTLKNIRNSELPQYIRAVPVIRDIDDLNKFIRSQKGELIVESRNYHKYDSKYHPLSDIMESIKSMR